MLRKINQLNAKELNSLAAGKKYQDGGGLYLLVKESGSKLWRMKYRVSGKEQLLSFGTYPEVSLAEARRRRDDARTMLRDGKDPAAIKRSAKQAAKVASENSFKAVATSWLEKQKAKMAPATYERAHAVLANDLLPWLGSRPIGEITAPELLGVLKRIEGRGARESAHRAKQRAGQIFRYAIGHGLAERDPSADLRGALAPVVSTPRAAITDPTEISALLRALDGYQGQFATRCALRLAPLLFVRPGELRAMQWAEIDFQAATWRIPAARMKMREAHIVPLATQALAILRELHPLTGTGMYCFPSLQSSGRPMSENTINAALRRLGYDKETMSGHGFRALASTRLNEMGWAPDLIERQLAHAERNKVRAVYNRAQYLTERARMMQAWADYLEALKSSDGRNVIPMHRNASS
ncbi:integrase [Ahniella affigens]|uniref:Integrase n=1 Tax=Ahniella affigens TaxID=2021234 RepID=A0A2P1PNM6_9GAMM|nr:tyrosine-type recombinase/integrase [Ahniella affigens]AVP96448.1 integrase [Ahniella affigens]